MVLKPYEPTLEDLDWGRRVLRLLKDGGVLATGLGHYRMNRAERSLTLIWPKDPWHNPKTLWAHHHNHYLFQKLGWKVLPEVDWEKIETPDRAVN